MGMSHAEANRVQAAVEPIISDLRDAGRGIAAAVGTKSESIVTAIKQLSEMLLGITRNASRTTAQPSTPQVGNRTLEMASEWLVNLAKQEASGKASGQHQGDAKNVSKHKNRYTRVVLDGARDSLIKLQDALLKHNRELWNKVMPLAKEVQKGLQSMNTRSESRRRSTTIQERITGRLALLESTNTANQALSRCEMRSLYGNKLTALVENGNRRAIELVKLIDKRRHCHSGRTVQPAILESIDGPIRKLSEALGVSSGGEDDIVGLLRLATSQGSFKSQRDFKDNLMEGLLLNVTAIASKFLSIPSGEYVVMVTDPKQTMLIPASESHAPDDVITDSKNDHYDIHTKDLVNCWNKLERVIGEASPDRGVPDYDKPLRGTDRIGRPALKKKVEAAGGVRATAEKVDLSPGDVSKHVNNQQFEISGDSARAYMNGIGADPDDLYKYGEIRVHDYDGGDSGDDERQPRRKRRGDMGEDSTRPGPVLDEADDYDDIEEIIRRRRAEDEAREKAPYHEILKNGWLWYSKGEGKVRREWVSEICRKAGVDPSSLQEGTWHKIPK